MYPSHDLNPIAFEHWQRERLAADIARVDAMAARNAQSRGHGITAFLGRFFRRTPDAEGNSTAPSSD